MNPEFVRNIWLELTGARLVLVIGLIGIISLAVWISPTTPISAVELVSLILFYIITVFWGCRRAANTVAGEVAGHTWEGQVMSAMGAWSMSWGKLFGGTSLIWLAGLICLANSFAAEIHTLDVGTALANVGLRMGIAFFGQAVAFTGALVILRKTPIGKPIGATMSQLLGIAAAIGISWALAPTATQYDWIFDIAQAQTTGFFDVSWYGLDAGSNVFRLASMAVFLAWVWLAANRMMRGALQYQSWPWAWTAFVIFMMVYMCGFISAIADYERYMAVAFTTSVVLLYPAVLSDLKDPITYRWLGNNLKRRQWGMALTRMPLWMVGMALTVIVAVLLAPMVPFTREGTTAFWEYIALAALDPNAESTSGITSAYILAVLLFAVRDICVVHMLAFSQAGRFSDVLALIVLLVLYSVLPIVALAVKLGDFTAAFVPVDIGRPAVTLIPIAVQALVMLFLVRMVARNAMKPVVRKPAEAAPAPAATETAG